MSKSLGNLVFVSDLRKVWDTRAIRLAVVAHHYRHPWDWTDEVMEHAAATLARWDDAAARAGRGGEAALAAVRAALDDDLDTPTAVRVIDEAADAGDDITAAAALLGLDLARPDVPVT
jgi:L-cysteine:1D-myo-inositol 2-amino-2-deoxy-alpha-D-glucopyranoside ligase